MPHAVDWEESDLKVADCLPGRGAGAGRPRDDDKRDAVEAALTDAPQSVRNIARTARVARSTVQDILAELAEDGDASKLDNGWVSGNSGHLITGHPQGDPENRSTKPNQVSENRSENGAHRTPGDAITGHPNGHDADAVLDRLREKFPDLEAVEVAARCACGDRALPDTDEDGDGQCARCGRGTA